MGTGDEGFTPKRAVVVGSVESTAVLVEELVEDKYWSLPLVVTLPEDLQHRHSDFVDMAPYAGEARSRLLRTRRSNDPEVVAAINAVSPDYIFVVGWSQMCDPAFLGIRPGRVIGYHPAPIPRLRGRAVMPWTILLRETISASTLFWLDERATAGPVLAQEFFHVAPRETVQELYYKHMHRLRLMLRRVLPRLGQGQETRIPQDEQYATWAARRTPEDGRIDWRNSAQDIDCLVRAVGRPYSGAFSTYSGRVLTIWSSSPEECAGLHCALPGQIVEQDGLRLMIMTGDGVLRLDEWELEGGIEPPTHGRLGQ